MFSASSASAIRFKHTGKIPATDFHLVFDGPVAGLTKVKDTWDTEYGRPDASDPNALNFGGKWNMGEGAIFDIERLGLARNPKTSTQLSIVSWKFTPDSLSDPQPPPQIFYQPDPGRPGQWVTLPQLDALGVHVIYVPEPAAWVLMVSGFGLVGVAARRRERRVV